MTSAFDSYIDEMIEAARVAHREEELDASQKSAVQAMHQLLSVINDPKDVAHQVHHISWTDIPNDVALSMIIASGNMDLVHYAPVRWDSKLPGCELPRSASLFGGWSAAQEPTMMTNGLLAPQSIDMLVRDQDGALERAYELQQNIWSVLVNNLQIDAHHQVATNALMSQDSQEASLFNISLAVGSVHAPMLWDTRKKDMVGSPQEMLRALASGLVSSVGYRHVTKNSRPYTLMDSHTLAVLSEQVCTVLLDHSIDLEKAYPRRVHAEQNHSGVVLVPSCFNTLGSFVVHAMEVGISYQLRNGHSNMYEASDILRVTTALANVFVQQLETLPSSQQAELCATLWKEVLFEEPHHDLVAPAVVNNLLHGLASLRPALAPVLLEQLLIQVHQHATGGHDQTAKNALRCLSWIPGSPHYANTLDSSMVERLVDILSTHFAYCGTREANENVVSTIPLLKQRLQHVVSRDDSERVVDIMDDFLRDAPNYANASQQQREAIMLEWSVKAPKMNLPSARSRKM